MFGFNHHIMYTTYHITSAQEVNAELLVAIKATFKSRPITIILEEDEENFDLSNKINDILGQRVAENKTTYLTTEKSLRRMKKKHGL